MVEKPGGMVKQRYVEQHRSIEGLHSWWFIRCLLRDATARLPDDGRARRALSQDVVVQQVRSASPEANAVTARTSGAPVIVLREHEIARRLEPKPTKLGQIAHGSSQALRLRIEH